uniref:FLYWCH-type domain-containing protein n=1 Tax=Panagrolaimus davidi TaxID=227884 RepID=A0A914PH92_9BILA
MHRIEIKKVKGNKNPFLFVNQYQFYYCNSDKNKTKYFWKCKKYNCKGIAHTNSIETNAILIKNDGHNCIPNLQSNIPMPTTPSSMPYYSDSTAAAAYGTPPLTNSVSVAATPSVSSLIESENPNMLKARVSVGNLNASRDSREMLCNENSPILYDRVLVNDFPQLELIVIYYVTIGIIALIFIHIALYPGEVSFCLLFTCELFKDTQYYTCVPAEDDKQVTNAPISVAPAAADALL